MALWVDSYRPTTLDKLDCHPDITQQLRRLAAVADLPHLLVYGPPGAGKKTRIMAMLHELFGSSVERLKMDKRQFEVRLLSLQVVIFR